MPLPPSGPISMSMINIELAYPATQVISLNDAAVRQLAEVPAGMISLSNFYGKSSTVQKGITWGGTNPSPATNINFITDYATDTTTQWTATRAANGNALNTQSLAYAAAGFIAPASYLTGIDTYNWTTATVTPTVANTPVGKVNMIGAGGDGTVGWFFGGNGSGGGGSVTGNFKLTAPTNTVASLVNSPSPANQTLASGRKQIYSSTKNYAFGTIATPGLTPSNGATMRFVRSTETFTTPVTTAMPVPLFGTNGGGGAATTNYPVGIAYCIGAPSPVGLANVGKFNLNTETLSFPAAMPQTVDTINCHNSSTYAIGIGGQTPTTRTRRMKFTFATDTSSPLAAVPVGLNGYACNNQPAGIMP